MFTTTAVITLSLLSAVSAVVVPSEPGPGAVFNEGGQCHLSWKGDTASPGNWQDMTIKLRTGSNLDMKDITVIASGQDGTKDGVYDYPCPDVTPQSAIYFYEFTAPGAAAEGAQWTTRFAIADSTGATTPPANDKQPSGDPIPWGEGTLQSGTASGNLSSGGVMSSTPAVSATSASASASDAASGAVSSGASSASANGMSTARAAAGTGAAKAPASAATNAVTASESTSPNAAISVRGGGAAVYGLGAAVVATAVSAVFTLLL